MLITTPYVRFEMVTSSQEFNFSSSGNQPFANMSRLRIEDKEDKDFISLELNKSVLNYTLDNADNLNNLAFVSNTLSDNNCQFNNVYVLAQSNDPKNFLALSLDFGVNFPKKIRVVYESSNSQNNRETIIDNIDDRYVFVNIRAQSVARVYVYFLESWAPFEFAYLQKTDFGVIYKWSKDDIIDLIVNEETPYFCTTLPVDTAKLTVYIPNDQFDMINSNNVLDYINQDQKFKISEEIEDTETGEVKTINFGTYYLDNIKNESEHKVTFNLSTILSKLDKKDFRVSDIDLYGIYNVAYDVILSIFIEAGLSNYVEIDESLKNEHLKGYIPFMSCRAALQQVLFVTKSVLDDNRTDKVFIRKMDYSVSQVVDMDKIFYPYDIEQDNSASRISYEYFSYFRNFFGKETLATISVNDTKPLTVNFSKPIDKNTLEVNAIVATKHTLYATIVPMSQNPHDITLQAITYLEIKYTGEVTSGNSENIKKFDINGVKLLNKDNAPSIMNSLAEFNSKMITYKIEYLCTGQETGKYTKFILGAPLKFVTSDNKQFVDSQNREFLVPGKQIIGWLQRQTIDLAHGMVAKAEIVLRK